MLLDSAPVEQVRFSTDPLPFDRRADAVAALRERGCCRSNRSPTVALASPSSSGSHRGATLLSGTLDGVRQLGGRVPDDGVFVGINAGGTSHAVQGRLDVTFGAGDAVVIDPADGPFAVTRPESATFLGLRLDRALAGTGDRGLRVLAKPAVALLSGYLRLVAAGGLLADPSLAGPIVDHAATLVAAGGLLADPSLAGPIVDHAATLVALAAETNAGDAPGVERSVGAARLLAIKADIEANLTDPELGVAALAARHGVSPRYVHKLFEAEDTTCAGYLLRRRLQRAHRLLVDPRIDSRTISAIAFDAGFGDLSSFNRAFRRAYDATPSDVRRIARVSRASPRASEQGGSVSRASPRASEQSGSAQRAVSRPRSAAITPRRSGCEPPAWRRCWTRGRSQGEHLSLSTGEHAGGEAGVASRPGRSAPGWPSARPGERPPSRLARQPCGGPPRALPQRRCGRPER